MLMGIWSHKENSEKGTVNLLSNYIYGLENSGRIYLPDLREADNLYLFSDYSGSKDQQLISYSILALDENSFHSFVAVQKIFWENCSLGTRIIDYKGLNDSFKKEALVPFLQLCNNLNGLVFTAIFHKNTKSIFRSEIPNPLKEQLSIWKNKAVVEKFLRLREFILLILNGLGREYQNILWVTDNDDIVANDLQLMTANAILKETLVKHLDFNISNFELKSLDVDSPDRCLEKLCSLTDLAAGGLVDFVGDYHKGNIILKEGEIAKPISHSKDKVNPITNWLSKYEEKSMLKKITIKINEIDKDNLSVETYRFPEII
jgi:hypothetical protein